MRPTVFLGMSLHISEARMYLDADYRPPIRRGDLPGLPDSVKLVGIIDGVFMDECSVGHREIIALLRRGVTVVGGGSMGALRASELQDVGMIGVGKVFNMYRDGTIEGDDEVALTFNPETFDALSEPLVNMRGTLASAVEQEIIEADIASSILEEVRKEYFPRRNNELMVRRAMEMLDEDTGRVFSNFVEKSSVDLKKRDAIEVLRTIAELEKAANRSTMKKSDNY